MSSHNFQVKTHVSPCQHIREYPRATANKQEAVLNLAVKQYTPLDNLNGRLGDVTIIAAHANGFPKELYEPLWDEILARSGQAGFRIRSIWIADVAQQGESGVLNEHELGNDPCWHDHPRDLLHFINTKREQMPRPIVGIGHSFGSTSLVNLSYIHPRLLASLILMDPVIHNYASLPPVPGRPSPAALSTFRRDVWPSRRVAAESFKSSVFYQKWDKRVLDRWMQFGLRDLPTLLHSGDGASQSEPPVTLTTSKHQEVFTFLRPNYDKKQQHGAAVNRLSHPDLNTQLDDIHPFYRAEGPRTFARLPELRPSVLYIFGGVSEMTMSSMRKAKLDSTGVGVGGSGGAKEGRVKEVIIGGAGHLVALEAVERCADAAADWLGAEIQRLNAEDEEFYEQWNKKSLIEKSTVDDKWKEIIRPPTGQSRHGTKSKI